MKKFLKKKYIIPLIIIILVIIAFFSCNGKQVSVYEEETPMVRDIITYRNFTGNVSVDNEKDVVSKASQQVVEVLVSEGDTVKKGDVIAILDSETLKQNIEMKEELLSSTELSNYYNQRDALKNYKDYKDNLDAGLNSQINGAKANLDNAYTSALMAQRALDEAREAYMQTEPYASSKTAYETAESTFNAVKERYEAADETAKAAMQQEYDAAKASYETALATMDAMNSAMENSVRTLSDSVLTAVSAYNTAQANYDAAVKSVDQTLEAYANAVDKVNGLSTTETSKMELDNLYDQLDDYTIKADMDGVITSLPIKAGSMVTSGMTVAEISDFSKLKVDIKIDEYDILGVEEGKAVDIYIDSIEKNYDGKISKISKKAVTEGGVSYFTSEVEFAADDDVRSGMSVEVKLVSREVYNVMSVSMDALRYEKDNTAYVLVRNSEGKEEKRAVTVGITDGNYVEIKEGLSENDIVLVTPKSDYMSMMMEMQ